jgi:hypothetical protein
VAQLCQAVWLIIRYEWTRNVSLRYTEPVALLFLKDCEKFVVGGRQECNCSHCRFNVFVNMQYIKKGKVVPVLK